METLNPEYTSEILLVEDSDDDAELVSSIIQKNNINSNVLRVKTGEEAIEFMFQRGKYASNENGNLPKVVLLDINLPKMNGLDVLQRMKSNEKTEHLPVFVFTSSGSDYTVFQSYKLGVTSFIRKQTTYEEFEQALLQIEIYLHEYKVLILEDNESDALIVKSELENSSLKCVCKIARNRKEYEAELAEFKPDIVFSDYDLSATFDAMQAIHILKETKLNIPFILITGKLNEELASSCLIEGMDDYLLKGQLKKFPLTLINNLKKKKLELEKNNAIEALKRSEKELRTLFDSMNDVFFSADVIKRKVIQISPSCEKVYGFTQKQFMSDPDLWIKCVHPDDMYLLADMREKILKGETAIMEVRIIHNDKSIRWTKRKIIPTLNETGVLIRVDGVTTDITKRKLAEIESEKSEERYKNIVETAQEGIWTINELQKTTYVNDKLCQMLECSKEELMEKNIFDFMDEEWQLKATQIIESQKNETLKSFEFKFITKSKKVLWVSISSNAFFSADKKYVGAMAMITDITEKRNAELEKKEYIKGLEEIMFMTSHEVRQPIAHIISCANLLDENDSIDEIAKLIHYIKESALSLDSFTRKLTVFVDKMQKMDFRKQKQLL